MTAVTLNNTGQKMPLVNFGIWKIPNNPAADTIYHAIKHGYKLFGGAPDYGNEKKCGEDIARAIKDGSVKREDLFVTSKLLTSFQSKNNVKSALKRVLADKNLDHVDLFLIHFPIAQKYVDSSVCDSSVCDSSVRDSPVRDSPVCDSSVCDSSVCDSSVCDSSVCDSSARDSSVRDPSVRDPSVCDPSVCDLSVCDPSVCDSSVYDPSVRDPPAVDDDKTKELYCEKVPINHTWAALEECVKEGLVKNIGVSNFEDGLIRDFLNTSTVRSAVLQIGHHPYLSQEPLVSFVQSEGFVITVYSSLGPQPYVKMNHSRVKNLGPLLNQHAVGKIAKAHNKSSARTLLRRAIQRGIAVIPKSCNENRLASNLQGDGFDLVKEKPDEISASNINFRFNVPADWNSPTPIF